MRVRGDAGEGVSYFVCLAVEEVFLGKVGGEPVPRLAAGAVVRACSTATFAIVNAFLEGNNKNVRRQMRAHGQMRL